jgi:hypothetical protein
VIRRWFLARRRVGSLLALALLASGCWFDDDPKPTSAGAATTLPFSLTQVVGTTAVGRPAVFDGVTLLFKDKPVVMAQLRAAYRVTSKDPVAVFRQWLDQLASLQLGEIGVRVGGDPGEWLTASAFGGPHDPARPPTGSFELGLWRTENGTYLLVDVARRSDGQPAPASTPPFPAAPTPPAEVPDRDRRTGDVLFTEQGHEMHMPPRCRDLMPSLPTSNGTGGSTSILAVEDASAAVESLLDEGRSLSAGAEVRGPTTTTQQGVQVTEASFDIGGGGWGFRVLAVRGKDDNFATLWVTSYAD